MAYLICEDLSFSYDGRKVINHLSFSVDKGALVCIVGENGAGKSTLVKGILGLKKADTGSVKLADGRGHSMPQIGYLPQQSEQVKDFPASVREVVRSGCLGARSCSRQGFSLSSLSPFYSKFEKRQADAAMERMGILELADRNCSQLSGGQKQRMLLARGLCAAGRLFLLDEPTAGLDTAATADLYQLIAELNREDGMTILMVTHDPAVLPRLATHVLHLGHHENFYGTWDEYRATELGKRYLGGEIR
ncbi:MAG: metal ABC transporter ATP-binding protein [Eubacteriales bacterium]